MVFGFVVLSNVTGGSLIKNLMMTVVGLIIGTIGLDPVTGNERFTFGSPYLLGGIEFVAVAIGVFGIGEILSTAAKPAGCGQRVIVPRLRDTTDADDLKRYRRHPAARNRFGVS
jgi:TctA family transporter